MGKVRSQTERSNEEQPIDWQKAFADLPVIREENFSQAVETLPYHTRSLMRILLRLELGELFIWLPDDRKLRFVGKKEGPSGSIRLNNWQLPKKAAIGGSIGVAESYMDGDWDSPDVTALLELFSLNVRVYDNIAEQSWIANLLETLRHWFNENTHRGSKRNIAAHYDLGNEFYKLWLDPTMTYSSAIFEDGANSLESAQNDKYRSLARSMGVTENSHVLEIGCGWGGFAEFVAREIGASVTGLTISREQFDYAQQRIAKAGLGEKVNFKFQDYRDETGTFDQIASIEMFEAVGEKYWPTYFSKIRECLKDTGTAGLQIITIEDQSFETYRKRPDFIQRYIFPGGMLPSPMALSQVSGAEGLKLQSERIFPQDYARTLREWRLKFWEKWDEICRLGFDLRFKRMWEFYLQYCEAGFKTEGIDVRQMFYRKA